MSNIKSFQRLLVVQALYELSINENNFKIVSLVNHQAPNSKEELSIYFNKKWYLIKVKSEKIFGDFKSLLFSAQTESLLG